jgi:hypothetical protein
MDNEVIQTEGSLYIIICRTGKRHTNTHLLWKNVPVL